MPAQVSPLPKGGISVAVPLVALFIGSGILIAAGFSLAIALLFRY
jgi:hypothetical protein